MPELVEQTHDVISADGRSRRRYVGRRAETPPQRRRLSPLGRQGNTGKASHRVAQGRPWPV